MVEYMQQGGVEDVERRAFGLADFAIHGLSYLAKRRKGIGRLFSAVAKELVMAESLMADLHLDSASVCERCRRPLDRRAGEKDGSGHAPHVTRRSSRLHELPGRIHQEAVSR